MQACFTGWQGRQPLQRLKPVLLQLLTFNIRWGECRVESEALCAPGKLVKQVFA